MSKSDTGLICDDNQVQRQSGEDPQPFNRVLLEFQFLWAVRKVGVSIDRTVSIQKDSTSPTWGDVTDGPIPQLFFASAFASFRFLTRSMVHGTNTR
jgi:acyl-ACP thioesterase